MRTIIWSTLITLTVLSATAVASERIEFRFDLPEGFEEEKGVTELVSNSEPFSDDWKVESVEDGNGYYCDSLGCWRVKKSELPEIKREQLFGGMWTPLAARTSVIYSRCVVDSPPVVRIRPFDMQWLTDAMWPRTRSYLARRSDFENDPQDFNRIICSDPIQYEH